MRDSSSLEVQRVRTARDDCIGKRARRSSGGYEHERSRPVREAASSRSAASRCAARPRLGRRSRSSSAPSPSVAASVRRERQRPATSPHMRSARTSQPFDGLKFSRRAQLRLLRRVAPHRRAGIAPAGSPRPARLVADASARQVALDVRRTRTLSDGNRRWEFTISPRRSVARTERLNLDLGVSASQLGHDRRTSTTATTIPRRYEFYAVTAYPYWKVSENIGLGLSLALGAQRDDCQPEFRFGGNATAEATFGIYTAMGAQGERRRTSSTSGSRAARSAGTARASSLIRRF